MQLIPELDFRQSYFKQCTNITGTPSEYSMSNGEIDHFLLFL